MKSVKRKFKDPNYLRAIKYHHRAATLKEGSPVSYCGEEFIYKGTIKGGNIKIQNPRTKKYKNVNFLSVVVITS